MDLVARRVEVRYTDDWRPIELVVDATLRGQPLSIQTNVTGQTAQTHLVNSGQSSDKTDTIPEPTNTPRSRAAASSAPMPPTNSRASARSR